MAIKSAQFNGTSHNNTAQSLPAAVYPQTSSILPDDIQAVAEAWVSSFNEAIKTQDLPSFGYLFFEDCYWRDHLAISWDIRTIHGFQSIVEFVGRQPRGIRLQSATIDNSNDHTPQATTIDQNKQIKGIRMFLDIRTDVGIGKGIVRIFQDVHGGLWKAFTLFTTLQSLHGHGETIGHRRPHGLTRTAGIPSEAMNGHTDGMSYMDSSSENDPSVLIVGAGQSGLMTCARLQQMHVLCLVIDRKPRVGDNWRDRYQGLILHDPVWYNQLPYLPFPESWPVFTPKDRLADWMEVYCRALDLNVWTSTNLKSAKWEGSRWTVNISRTTVDGGVETHTLHPRHIIQATGQSGEINVPYVKDMEKFQGSRMCHSSHFGGAQKNGQGKHAVILGSCNSAHDIAQDYYEHGYHVTMIQRSSACVDPTRYLTGKGLYAEDGPSTEDADLVTQSLPNALMKRNQIEVTERLQQDYHHFFDGLRKAGFALDNGPDGAGRKLKYLERGGGYYIEMGASQLIIDGHIKIHQGSGLDRVTPHGLRLIDGTELPAEEIVFATGYHSMRETARKIFGDKIADQVNEVWGLDEEGELKSVWRRSGHPGFWFAGGNLSICRYYSRLLAIQIKAVEEGIMQYDSP